MTPCPEKHPFTRRACRWGIGQHAVIDLACDGKRVTVCVHEAEVTGDPWVVVDGATHAVSLTRIVEAC